MERSEFRYDAFISYRHVEPDRTWAKWLHQALETYRVPKRLVKPNGAASRVGRVFRDEEELPASADLSKEIESALQQSRFLIVICSPRTPQSEWVNREIQRFREMGRGDRILALLIEGEPSESFPKSLVEIRRTIVDGAGATREEIESAEPLAADVRLSRQEGMRHLKRMALLRMLACVLGCRFDDLRQREQERHVRRLTAIGAAMAALVLVMAGLTALAVYQRSVATAERVRAERARDTAVATTTFLQETLAAAGPERAKGREVSVREALDAAAKTVTTKFANQPETEAAIRLTIGFVYRNLGLYSAAEEHLRAAFKLRREILGPNHPDTLTAMHVLASLISWQARHQEAEPMLRELLETRRRVLGPEHPDTLASMASVAEVLAGQRKSAEAEALYRETLALSKRIRGPEHPDTLLLMSLLGDALMFQQKREQAEALTHETLALMTRILGENDTQTVYQKTKLGGFCLARGAFGEAETLFRDLIEHNRKVHGPDSPHSLSCRFGLASAFSGQGKHDEAVTLCRGNVDASARTVGKEHPQTLNMTIALARMLLQANRPADAEPILRETLAVVLRTLGPAHRYAVDSRKLLADALEAQGRKDEAERTRNETQKPP